VRESTPDHGAIGATKDIRASAMVEASMSWMKPMLTGGHHAMERFVEIVMIPTILVAAPAQPLHPLPNMMRCAITLTLNQLRFHTGIRMRPM